MPRSDDSDDSDEAYGEPSRNGSVYEDAEGANQGRDDPNESNEEIQEAEQPRPQRASKPSLQFEYHPVITGMRLFIP